MATLNGSNYAKTIASPIEKVQAGEFDAKVKVIIEKYSLVGVVLAIGDEILGPSLPAGAKVIDAYIACANLGTAGILDLGHKASTDVNGGVIAEDQNAFVDQLDGGTSAPALKRASVEAGIMKKFYSSTQIYAKCTEASTLTAGDVVFCVSYLID